MELFFDDINLLTKNRDIAKVTEQVKDEPDDLDSELDEDIDESYDEKDDINKFSSSLNIADDSDADGEVSI